MGDAVEWTTYDKASCDTFSRSATGLTVVPVIGSESRDAAMQLTVSFLQAIVIALPFVWLAHLVFPDAESKPEQQPAAAPDGPLVGSA